ncbi:dihydrolipoyl dehydrogenase family protein [Labilithrix luteola]|nr:NAD(P)/FAD-dependent oxidoreductase [Labilithrix luteola]
MRVVVIGGGPAGLAAALRAAELGAEVTLLERARLGGICFEQGPAPVRALAHAARLVRDSTTWPQFGLRGPHAEVDMHAVIEAARVTAARIHESKNLEGYARARGVTVVQNAGASHFVDPRTVRTERRQIFTADRFVIATGGHSRSLTIPGNEYASSYAELWALEELPRRIAIVGGASTGCQLASVFIDLGVEVTLVETLDRLVPAEDRDVSLGLERTFRARGVRVSTSARVERIDHTSEGLVLKYHTPRGVSEAAVDVVVFAIGWPGNIDELNLAAAGVRTSGSHIRVDEQLRTTAPHVFAVGDINGLSMLVQSAALQGRVAAENAVLGTRRTWESIPISSGCFTDPEYASVGPTEDLARRRGPVAVALVPYDQLTRAVVDHHTDGFCKMIADRQSGQLVAVHVLGENASEIVQIGSTSIAAGLTVEQISDIPFAYPTYGQVIALGALRLAHELGRLPRGRTWDSTEMSDVDGTRDTGPISHSHAP